MAAAAHDHSHETVRNPGPYEISSRGKALILLCIAIGVAAFLAGLSVDAKRTWTAFLINHFYFLSLAMGGLFIAAVQWLTSAMWSAPVRRISESFVAYLPIAAVLTIVLYFGLDKVYLWTDTALMHRDLALIPKIHWLTSGFFTVRNVVFILIWILFAKILIGGSIVQDTTRDAKITLRNRALSAVFMVVFALTYTLASFDLMMSMDPYWYSTIFGVYCFAGLFYSSLALTCIVTLFLRERRLLDGIVSEDHLHDLGKFMFAFTIFWAYIGFAQFLLIWYANMPEETLYFIHRFHNGWFYISCFLLFGKFMVPFFLLLPRDAKRDDRMLWIVGIFMLIAQWIDVMWMVQPEIFTEGPRLGWIEIGEFLGFLGLFGVAVSRFLAKHNIVAIGDPKLAQAVFHHHQ